MEIRNLTKEDVDVLQEKIAELKKDNPDIVSEVYTMGHNEYEGKELPKVSNELVLEAVERLDRKLDLIFGKHVLINGIWFDNPQPGIKEVKP